MDAVYDNTMAEQQNDEIEKTVRKERGRLFNFIRKRVDDIDDAEDILQDVFSQLVESYRGLEQIERVSAWLFRVARNKITDLFRKKKPQPLQQNVPTGKDGEVMHLEDILPALSDSPEELYMRDLIWNEIEQALDDLPEAQRDVFVWHEFEGMRFRDMAILTGESENTLRLRKHYAIRFLRARLVDLYDEL